MLLSDEELYEAMAEQHLVVAPPPGPEAVQPSSIDLRLDKEIWEQRPDTVPGLIIDPSIIDVTDHLNRYGTKKSAEAGTPFRMNPGNLVIGKTLERVELSNNLAARVEGKSSLARLGLLIHLTAPKIDPGFRGQITLEMYNLGPFILELKEGMDICSLMVERLGKPARQGYRGRFQSTSE